MVSRPVVDATVVGALVVGGVLVVGALVAVGSVVASAPPLVHAVITSRAATAINGLGVIIIGLLITVNRVNGNGTVACLPPR
jgi:hypothetical protein